jgi:8-amino-7-oxononanoate synthase
MNDPLQLPADLGDLPERLRMLDARQLRRRRRIVEQLDGPRMVVEGRSLLAFCSNDYLGIAQHPALIEAAQQAAARWGVSASASPLVCGHSAAHEALERELAQFVGLPRALYFVAGFLANVGLVPALAGKGDAIFSDALNHASLIDGARLSGAQVHIYPHNDVAALAAQLQASRAPRKLVVTDAVFSMDGDIAPLRELLALCERHDAWLMVDDAHGFGVLGPRGEGTAAHLGLRSSRLVYMATLGKAAGVGGAFVAGEAEVVEWLMQRARSYIFATGAPAMVAEALRASVQVMRDEGWRRTHLRELVARLRTGLAGLPWRLLDSPTAIQPLVVGNNAAALALTEALLERGLWVPAIRPPSVPEGTARLRITLSAAHTLDEVDRLVQALQDAAGPDRRAAI